MHRRSPPPSPPLPLSPSSPPPTLERGPLWLTLGPRLLGSDFDHHASSDRPPSSAQRVGAAPRGGGGGRNSCAGEVHILSECFINYVLYRLHDDTHKTCPINYIPAIPSGTLFTCLRRIRKLAGMYTWASRCINGFHPAC